ncbi:unnamed protein product [Caenorhabditis auriculariae]|uniref:Ribosome-recycling factor, mitochondrial n=1 Tax=Caenorhabditis auriculariae TaxID=2777116 RepID=A0A8S1HPB0_9PELO|nr:unnamed protein product [Caenorhabditis auriculariae]
MKKKQEKKKALPLSSKVSIEDNGILLEAQKEIKNVETLLGDELARHFSLQVDIRQYEDILVKLENGSEHKISHLGRVSMKNPLMVTINFADNPSAIKWAKLALQKSTLNVTPQQEGVMLYINIQPMTRQRREQLASDAKTKLFNEYKRALNEIYSKSDRKSSAEFSAKPDEAKKTREKLLEMKHYAESSGLQMIELKKEQLLKQVA